MLENIKVFKQNSIKIGNIYIDPFGVDKNYNDAKYVFITHDHYDHFSKEDIAKVINSNTIFILPMTMKDIYDYDNEALFVSPEQSYMLDNIKFKTVRMYNINKQFHQKNKDWCGYIIYLNDICYYIMGDTDDIDEIKGINCDVVFIPIGGTFTMTKDEAIKCLDKFNYQYAIPVHYGSIVGDKKLGIDFKTAIGDKCILKIK